MRKINLTNKKLRFQRILTKRFANFRGKLKGTPFKKQKLRLFKTFTLRRRILLKLASLKRLRLVIALKANRFYKLLIKNTQFLRRFYGDMKKQELARLGHANRFQKKTKKWGVTNLILQLDNRLNSFLIHDIVKGGVVNSIPQLKQYILHGKVQVNNKIIRGYNYRIQWMDDVSLGQDVLKNFYLQRVWRRYYYYKLRRLKLKTKALSVFAIRTNLLRESFFNLEQFWNQSRKNFSTNYYVQRNYYIKRLIISLKTLEKRWEFPVNLRKKWEIARYSPFRMRKRKRIRSRILFLRKKMPWILLAEPKFIFLRCFLLMQKISYGIPSSIKN